MPKNAIPEKNGAASWNRLYHQKPDGTFALAVAAGAVHYRVYKGE